ncbi:MAG: hypothetical protein KC933_18360 [Myxococcales bacterium]|nr:hypothetical protein [Myxococcales bacterium]
MIERGVFTAAFTGLLVLATGCSGSDRPRPDGTGSPDSGVGSGGDGGNTASDAGAGATFCGYVETIISICDGRRSTSWDFYCVEGRADCASGLKPNTTTRDQDPLCYQRTENLIYRNEAVAGTCAQYIAWQNRQIECFRDDQCYAPLGTATCVDNACVCPEGVNCDCGPRAPVCDGDVLINWNIDEACNYLEDRFDCSELGSTCDPQTLECAPGGARDGGVVDGGNPGADAGPTAPDAGPTAPDAGPECVVPEDCPEVPPPQPGTCYVRQCIDGACIPRLESGPGCR